MRDFCDEVTKGIVSLDLERMAPLLREALEEGQRATQLLEALTAGMVKVGELFHDGEYFLADLVLAGEVMKEALSVIEGQLPIESRTGRGTVVLCTVKGDVHDIGKNLVGSMLASSGYRVVDLGVDVHEDRIVEAIRQHRATALALSVLLTPMVSSVADVISALSASGLRDKVTIAIGGACTTEQLVSSLGVDAMGRDPFDAIRIFDAVSADPDR